MKLLLIWSSLLLLRAQGTTNSNIPTPDCLFRQYTNKNVNSPTLWWKGFHHCSWLGHHQLAFFESKAIWALSKTSTTLPLHVYTTCTTELLETFPSSLMKVLVRIHPPTNWSWGICTCIEYSIKFSMTCAYVHTLFGLWNGVYHIAQIQSEMEHPRPIYTRLIPSKNNMKSPK